MNLIIDIALSPTETARLTPLELLEDFADASPGWHYLEEASRHYAAEKGGPACILRHLDLDGSTDVDLAFSVRGEHTLRRERERSSTPGVHLTIVDPQGEGRSLALDQRNAILDRFLDHLRTYLEGRSDHVDLRVERDEVDPSEVVDSR